MKKNTSLRTIGPISAGSGGRGFGGFDAPRTNYVYLPGQTLAPEAIYFDHIPNLTNLTKKQCSRLFALRPATDGCILSRHESSNISVSRFFSVVRFGTRSTVHESNDGLH